MPSPASTAALRQRAPRLAEAAVERARLTVVPRARTRAARVPFVSLVTLLLLGGVVGLLLFNTSMQQSSFTATSLEQRATLLSAREESLGMQLENLRDPQVVARKAQQLRQGRGAPIPGEVPGSLAAHTSWTYLKAVRNVASHPIAAPFVRYQFIKDEDELGEKRQRMYQRFTVPQMVSEVHNGVPEFQTFSASSQCME